MIGPITLETPVAHVLRITLDRPKAANALNTDMARALIAALEGLPLDIRCIILTGRGERNFCAGGDLKERRGMSDEAWQAQHEIFEHLARTIAFLPVPVIAAVNGAAFGGGCEMVGLSTFAYAATHARFALTETSLGIIPGMGGTQTLPRAIGQRRAQELVLSATSFDAEQAAEWGLVNRLCRSIELQEAVLAAAVRIADNAPIAVRQAKDAIARSLDLPLAEGLGVEIAAYRQTIPTADRREGVDAFNERRKPVFRGD